MVQALFHGTEHQICTVVRTEDFVPQNFKAARSEDQSVVAGLHTLQIRENVRWTDETRHNSLRHPPSSSLQLSTGAGTQYWAKTCVVDVPHTSLTPKRTNEVINASGSTMITWKSTTKDTLRDQQAGHDTDLTPKVTVFHHYQTYPLPKQNEQEGHTMSGASHSVTRLSSKEMGSSSQNSSMQPSCPDSQSLQGVVWPTASTLVPRCSSADGHSTTPDESPSTAKLMAKCPDIKKNALPTTPTATLTTGPQGKKLYVHCSSSGRNKCRQHRKSFLHKDSPFAQSCPTTLAFGSLVPYCSISDMASSHHMVHSQRARGQRRKQQFRPLDLVSEVSTPSAFVNSARSMSSADCLDFSYWMEHNEGISDFHGQGPIWMGTTSTLIASPRALPGALGQHDVFSQQIMALDSKCNTASRTGHRGYTRIVDLVKPACKC